MFGFLQREKERKTERRTRCGNIFYTSVRPFILYLEQSLLCGVGALIKDWHDHLWSRGYHGECLDGDEKDVTSERKEKGNEKKQRSGKVS